MIAMFVHSKVNGFFLLLAFGLVCGLLAGALFGVGFVLYLQRAIGSLDVFVFFSGIGAAYGLIPGVLYGLSSYYFTNTSDWLFTGGVYGAIPGFVLFFGLGLEWHLLLISVGYGVFVAYINLRFPDWWGMRLRAEGIRLLRQQN